MPDQASAGLEESLLEPGQRPTLDGAEQGEPAQEIAEVVRDDPKSSRTSLARLGSSAGRSRSPRVERIVAGERVRLLADELKIRPQILYRW
jgi:hypothetical protein